MAHDARSYSEHLEPIRDLLGAHEHPVFYLSRTATNLLGVERFVPGLSFVALQDSWDGAHPRVFVPRSVPSPEPRGNVNVVNWLLRSAEVRQHIAERTPPGVQPRIVLAFFDEESERICAANGYELIMPPAALRERLDSKLVTTRLGESAGVASVPNVITTVHSWEELRERAAEAGLGEDLVVQDPYGNSGQTTYFVSSEADFARIAKKVAGTEVKVMRRIEHQPVAVDAVLTRHGTVVGPVLNEITGHPELTRYRGGWAGNEMSPSVLSENARRAAVGMVRRFGDRLAAEGYRGSFGVDLLIDTDTGEVYLGELNPRLSGALSISNIPTGAFSELPIFALHVLEYSGLDFSLDVDAVNALSAEALSVPAEVGGAEWSHMIVQHTSPDPERIDRAPRTGVYLLGADGRLDFVREALDWHGIGGDEVFYLNGLGAGTHRTHGSDLGVLFVRGRLQDDERQLLPRARRLIQGVQDLYETTPLTRLQNLGRKASLALGALRSSVTR